MGFRIPRERGAQGVDRDGGQRHRGQVFAAGDERGDRVEVLAVGLQRVRRGLPGAAVGEECGEPLRPRTVDTASVLGAVGHAPANRVRDSLIRIAPGEGDEPPVGRAGAPARRNAGITRWRYADMMFIHSLATSVKIAGRCR